MFVRAGRAALFDKTAFQEAFFDDDAMADAAFVVAIVGGLTFLGMAVRNLDLFNPDELVLGLLSVLVTAVVSWLILGFATWLAAAKLFGSPNRPQTLLALHGLAALPLLGEIVGGLVALVGLLWYLGVLVVGTREATELPFNKSAASVLIGFAAAAILRALMGVPFAIFGALF